MNQARKRIVRSSAALALVVAVSLILSACSGLDAFGESFNRAMHGVSATITTYNAQGGLIDKYSGKSIQISRDTRFDTTNSDGDSNADSEVLMISVGSSHISHVGSTLLVAQAGLNPIAGAQTSVQFKNDQPGTPWLNNLFEYNRNLWKGKGKTVIVRSQQGWPIAVYAGNEVEIFSTDIPKSTWVRIDGKYLLIYRADYSIVDNDLLK